MSTGGKIVKRVSFAFLVTVLSIIWLVRYIKRKLNVMKIAQKEHFFYQENIQSRFEQTCKDCCLTSLSLTLTLDKKIRESSFAVEDITNSLQELSRFKVLGNEQKATKIELWNQLKITGFSRTITGVYSITFMHILNRIQLNLLGRLKYVDSVLDYGNSGYHHNESLISPDAEKAVLSLSWLFINKTVPRIYEIVKNQIIKDLSEVSLKSLFTEDIVFETIAKTRKDIDALTPLDIFIPSKSLPLENRAKWDKLNLGNVLDEIFDILDSPDLKNVFKSCLDLSFQVLHDSISQYYNSHQSPIRENKSPSDDLDSFPADLSSKKALPLANIIPVICHQYRQIMAGEENSFIHGSQGKKRGFVRNLLESFGL